MSDNGKAPAEVTTDRQGYSPDLLTPRDMLRAAAVLGDVLGERSPYDMFTDDLERAPFIIWCLRSRTDPSFTWEDALDTPYLGEFEIGDSRPPQTAPSPTPSPPGSSASGGSKRKPSEPAPEPSSASSSA
jgi:hypothetical protein